MNRRSKSARVEANRNSPSNGDRSLSVAIAGMALLLTGAAQAQDSTLYHGMCDASAAVALDATYFVVANDEDNDLRIFRRGQPQAVVTLPLSRYLNTTREADLEGAARIGTRIYWISSHGRNSSAKVRTDRYRFFVTEIDAATSPPALRPLITPHTDVLRQMLEAGGLRSWRLAEAAKLAPEAEGGLNIEGLADTVDGKLLIGFRNPVRNGKALVVTLRNPQQAATGSAADFGPAIGLDLGGRGVRAIERLDSGYLVVGGPTAEIGDFALYRWSGLAANVPQRLPDVAFGTLRPEALFTWPHNGLVQVLSDDGGIVAQGVACKDRPAGQRSFRSIDFRP
jgi:hypothetical protein